MFGWLEERVAGARRDYEKREAPRRMQAAEPWKGKWEQEANITAASWQALIGEPLFGVEPYPLDKRIVVNDWESYFKLEAGTGLVSPCGQWLYTHDLCRGGTTLPFQIGKRAGSAIFDGDVWWPALRGLSKAREGRWCFTPWMSVTPQEVVSLVSGTRRARGHVVVAGLGLGWQLIEVANRKQVECITLVEKDQGLVDWILPKVLPRCKALVDVIVGDARKVVPGLSADVALIDIDPYYGNNDFVACPKIPTVWVWGAVATGL